MKHLNRHCFGRTLILLILAVGPAFAAPELQIRPPNMDAQGRFWLYRNGPAHPPLPFSPYGWMSDDTNVMQLIRVDIKHRNDPNTVVKPVLAKEADQCIQIKMIWENATWASVAFISGPDKPAWWGETNRGRYYNLSTVAKKKLVFHARGERGGECIKAQFGMLGDKPFGDSLKEPILSEEIKLTKDWSRHEVDLKNVPPADLARICNGFGVIAERACQAGTPNDTVFYLDDIYFE